MTSIFGDTMEALHLGEQPLPSDQEVNSLKESFEKVNQGHVFAFYDSLSSSEKSELLKQLQSIEPSRVSELVDDALKPSAKKEEAEEEKPKVDPLPSEACASTLDSNAEKLDGWYAKGLEFIGANKVAVVLMAGGQGTRLGSSAPKGCYDIGLPSNKSLFQLQAERIVRVQGLAAAKNGGKGEDGKVVVPWYIMTSGPTRKPTEEFFEKNEYFGLTKENVIFFEQGVLPCISNEGKIIMESKHKVAVAPDGNGGLYLALQKSGVLEDLNKRGIEHVHAYCVDNCLVRVADPIFIGFSAERGASIATKVVRKRNAKESVGLIISKNGKPDVVEYSEIDQETAEAKDEGNKDLLKFRAANIVNHYYSVEFLNTIPEWATKLPHHIARKKIPYCDMETGDQQKPDKPNGIKLEQFVFDVFPRVSLDKFACLEVAREDEFSPLKNAKGTGEDDPDTSKNDVLAQGKKWVLAAGAQILSEEMGKDGIEVSPLISYGGEGLDFLKDQTITGPALLLAKTEQ